MKKTASGGKGKVCDLESRLRMSFALHFSDQRTSTMKTGLV